MLNNWPGRDKNAMISLGWVVSVEQVIEFLRSSVPIRAELEALTMAGIMEELSIQAALDVSGIAAALETNQVAAVLEDEPMTAAIETDQINAKV